MQQNAKASEAKPEAKNPWKNNSHCFMILSNFIKVYSHTVVYSMKWTTQSSSFCEVIMVVFNKSKYIYSINVFLMLGRILIKMVTHWSWMAGAVFKVFNLSPMQFLWFFWVVTGLIHNRGSHRRYHLNDWLTVWQTFYLPIYLSIYLLMFHSTILPQITPVFTFFYSLSFSL